MLNRTSVLCAGGLLMVASGVLGQTITTVAGGFVGDGLPAAQALLNEPYNIAFGPDGSYYIADYRNHRVRKVGTDGKMTTFAGTGVSGFLGDGGPATSAQLYFPQAVAVAPDGSVYIADSYNNRVRKVATDGTITTVAGTGIYGFTGDGGQATAAQIQNPHVVAVAPDGSLYIGFYGDIRKVATNGVITTVAGNGNYGYAGDNGPATSAQISSIYGIVVLADGTLFLADYGNSRIRKVSNGTITTYAGTGTCGYSGNGGPATSAALCYPTGLVYQGGTLYFTDSGYGLIRKIAPDGTITLLAITTGSADGLAVGNDGGLYTVGSDRVWKMNGTSVVAYAGAAAAAGDGGPAINAGLRRVAQSALAPDGTIYIADSANNKIRKITPSGVISTLAGTGSCGLSGDGGLATTATLCGPDGVAVGPDGSVYIADTSNSRIRRVTPDGLINNFAGTTKGFNGDNGPATSAQLYYPDQVAVGKDGTVYIADSVNSRIRKVSNGTITTIAGTGSAGYNGDGIAATAAQLNYPYGISVGADNRVYIADSYNNRIRRIETNGTITTLAGTGTCNGSLNNNGPAAGSVVCYPNGLAVAADGTVYYADSDNLLIRKISTAGIVSTVAGTGNYGFSGDGGAATSANLETPWSVALGPDGNLYVSDTYNYRLRKVTLSGGGTATVPITITSNPPGQQVRVDGNNVTTPQTLNWTPGSSHTLDVDSPQGTGSTRYLFASWSQGGNKSQNVTAPAAATTYTATLTTQYLLTKTTVPGTGGSITANPVSADNYYNAGTSVGLTATPATGFAFSGWSGDLTGTTNPLSVTMTAPRSVTASFVSSTNLPKLVITSYKLPTSGTIGVNLPGMSLSVTNQGTGAAGAFRIGFYFSQRPTVTVNDVYTGWSCSYTGLDAGATTTCAGEVGLPSSMTAGVWYGAAIADDKNQVSQSDRSGNTRVADTGPITLAAGTTFPITITSSPTGRSVSVDGSLYATPTTLSWTPGTSHTVAIASPQGSSGTRYVFDHWSQGGAASQTITAPTSATTYTAFLNTQYQLAVSVTPANGGTISLAPPSSDGFYAPGSVVQVQANAAAGFTFNQFTGGLTGSANPQTVTLNGPVSVAASFQGSGGPSTQVITTLAGGFVGDGGAAASGAFNLPYAVAFGPDGSTYIADTRNHRIRRIGPDGKISTFAGTGVSGYDQDGVPATSARLNWPSGVAVGPDGTVYITDSSNYRIRKVTPDGIINTAAGTGVYGSTGNGGPATAAQVGYGYGIAAAADGTLYVAFSSGEIRKITPDGRIVAFAGTQNYGFSGDGGPATSAVFYLPHGVAAGPGGVVYVADTSNHRIRRIGADGTITTIAGTGVCGSAGDNGPALAAQLCNPQGLAVQGGTVYVADYGYGRLRKITADGTISLVANAPAANVGIAGDGTLYVVGSDRLWKVDPVAGSITATAGSGSATGDGGPGSSAALTRVAETSVGPDGSVYAVDSLNGRVRKISPNGNITTFAGTANCAALNDGGPATNAGLCYPDGVFAAADGNVYIADTSNNRIRKVAPNGTITTVAGNGTSGFSGDNGQATAAQLSFPDDVAVATDGTIYIADSSNSRVRKVTTNGIITTIAGTGTAAYSGDGGPAVSAQLNYPYGIGIGPDNRVYIADSNNNRIRRINQDGTIVTVAGSGTCGGNVGDGGPATASNICYPDGVNVGPDGVIYFPDTGNMRIRRVGLDGTITTVAGNGVYGFNGDGGDPTAAALGDPWSVSVGPDGSLYIADTFNYRVRKISTAVAQAPLLNLSSANVTVNGQQGTAPQTTSVTVTSSIANFPLPLTAQVVSGNAWLSASLNSVSTPATLTISANPSALGPGNYNGVVNITSAPASNNPVSVGVSFVVAPAPTVSITINSAPSGRYVLVDGNAVVTPTTLSWAQGSTHQLDVQTPQTVGGARYVFGSWSQGGGKSQTVTVPASATTYTASFTSQFQLSTSVQPAGAGSIGVSPSSADGFYNQGASVNLTATAAQGYLFQGFSGDVSGASASQTVVMSSAKSVTANFQGNLRVVPTPATVSLNATQGSTATQNLTITGDPASYNIASDSSWLRTSVLSGQTSQTPITVTANAASLSSGSYTGNLLISGSNFTAVTVTVTFNVTPPAASARLLTDAPISGFLFTAINGGANPDPKTLTISSTGTDINFTATPVVSSSLQWLTVDKRTGTASAANPVALQIGIRVNGLDPAAYRGSIRLTQGNNNIDVPVELDLSPAQDRLLQVNVPQISLTSTNGSAVKASLVVQNPSVSNLNFTVSNVTDDGNNWLNVTPSTYGASAAAPGVLQVTGDPSNLAPNTYTGTITLTPQAAGSGNGAPIPPVTVPVSMVVQNTAANPTTNAYLGLADTSLSFQYAAGQKQANPRPLPFVVSGGTVSWTVTSSKPWATVSQQSGTSGPGRYSVDLSIDTTGLPAGQESDAELVFSTGGSTTPRHVPISVRILPSGQNLLSVDKAGLAYVAGSAQANQTVSVASKYGPLIVTPNMPWLKATSSSAGLVQYVFTVTVSVDPTKASPGENRGTVLIQDSSGQSSTVSVLLYVTPTGGVAGNRARHAGGVGDVSNGCIPQNYVLQFATVGSSMPAQPVGAPVTMDLIVIDDCGNPVDDAVAATTLSNGNPQLNLKPLGGGLWRATWVPAGAPTFTFLNGLAGNGGGNGWTVPIQPGLFLAAPIGLPVVSQTTPFQTAFGQRLSVLSPGLQFQINGSGFTTGSSDLHVILAGVELPILQQSDTALLVVTPPDLLTNVEAQLVVRRGDATSVPVTVALASSIPGMVAPADGPTIRVTGLGREADAFRVEGNEVRWMRYLGDGVWEVRLTKPLASGSRLRVGPRAVTVP